jgi:hypothetical protein
MLSRERNITTMMDTQPTDKVIVVSIDTEVSRDGRTRTDRRYETVGENPLAARDVATRQENVALAQAVSAGMVTTGEVLTGGALIANGILSRDVMTVLAGLGLLGAGYGTGRLTRNADRRVAVFANVRHELTKRYDLPTAPVKKDITKKN